MSDLSLVRKIEDAVYVNNNLLAISNGPETHYDEHSQEMTDVEMLDIILSGQKNVQSKFVSENWKEDHLESAVAYKAKAISDCVRCSNNSHIEAFTTKYPIDEDEDHIGVGFIKNPNNGKIAEYASDYITFVIKTNGNADLGFYMHTAYPDIENNRDVIKTNKDLSAILKDTPSYIAASPVEKAYMQYQISPDKPESPSSVYMLDSDNKDDCAIVIKQDTKNPNIERVIKVKQNSTSVLFKNKSTKETIPIKVGDKSFKSIPFQKCATRLRETFPKTVDIVTKMQSTINEDKHKQRTQAITKRIADIKATNPDYDNQDGLV